MKRILLCHLEKLAAAAAALAFAASAGWAWTGLPRDRTPVTSLRSPSRLAHGGERWAEEIPAESAAPWPEPGAQSGGPDWVYDLFTPPAIYYHPQTKSFAVGPPRNLAERTSEATEDAFEVELVVVRPEPYRLQLVGYFGVPGNYTGVFTSWRTRETLFGRAGRQFADLALTVKTVDVSRVAAGGGEAGAWCETTASAVVEEEQTGNEVTLSTRERRLTDALVATLRRRGADEQRELHVGDDWRCGPATYRVARLHLKPAGALVTRIGAGEPHPDTRLLLPEPGADEPVGRRRLARAEAGIVAREASETESAER